VISGGQGTNVFWQVGSYVVNEALRQGLSDLTTRPKQREPFQTKTVALGRLRLASIDNISESLAVAEAEAFK